MDDIRLRALHYFADITHESLPVEFERLRRLSPKWSSIQFARMRHIEAHLDQGDIWCYCFEPNPVMDEDLCNFDVDDELADETLGIMRPNIN